MWSAYVSQIEIRNYLNSALNLEMQNYEALAEALAKFTGYAGPLCQDIFDACRFHRLLLSGKFESYVTGKGGKIL